MSRFIHKITRFYADGHWKIAKTIGCELCDVLAVAYLLDPSIADVVDAYVDVETQGLCEGESVVYRTMFFPDKVKNCEVITKADSKKLFELFFEKMFQSLDGCILQQNPLVHIQQINRWQIA